MDSNNVNKEHINKEHINQKNNTFTAPQKNGVDYFMLGWSLIFNLGLKRFVFLPMLANIMIMSGLSYWFFSSIFGMVDLGLSYVPSWLHWMSYLVTLILILTMAIFFCYFFSTITNIIAAPFNGLLAEQVEAKLTSIPAKKVSWMSLIADLPRIFYREYQKLSYYLVRAIPLLLTYFIPIFGQFITPIIWFLFTAWSINMQYADYPFDNNKISFFQMRQQLNKDRISNLTFGSLVSLFTMIPLLNLVIMPVAVCGSTAMWVDRYRKNTVF